ncbi:MAG: trypsin-like peptidase domain-containing protein [Phaeospirillum sp.]|nr:trypsin-like peptidase domain-containing protein [Phaeospirillum sp.]
MRGLLINFAGVLTLSLGVAAPLAEAAGREITACDRLAASPFDTEALAPGIATSILVVEQAIPACKEAIARWPADLRLWLQYGRALFAAKDFQGAVLWYRMAADQGFAPAQNYLGVLYEKGKGVHQDDREAVKWFSKAADQGYASAQFNLGTMYDNYRSALGNMYGPSQGMPHNDAEAVKWLHTAADLDDDFKEFQRNRNDIFRNDENIISHNDAEAVKWTRKAADQGYASAQFNLGTKYNNGWGVRVNYAEAVKWYQKAADQGLANAQFELGLHYANGNGVPQDYTAGGKWIRKAADQGHVSAQNHLGVMYNKGHGVLQDAVAAYGWFSLAASRDPYDAVTNRDQVAARLTAAQITKAQQWTREWKPNKPMPQDGRATLSPRTTQATKETTSGAKAAVASKSLKEEPRTSSVIKSGFVISHDGDVLTTDSMIQQCRSITVQPLKGPPVVAKLVATDSVNNLALLKANLRGAEIARFREDKPMRSGDTVAAVGYPLSSPQSREAKAISGVISAMAGIHGDTRHYQITAPIQNGNGGGPLVDNSGNVIGVVWAKLNAARIDRQTEDLPPNIGFAIKAELARKFLGNHGIAYETAPTVSNLSAIEGGARIKRSTVAIECKLNPSAQEPSTVATGPSAEGKPTDPTAPVSPSGPVCQYDNGYRFVATLGRCPSGTISVASPPLTSPLAPAPLSRPNEPPTFSIRSVPSTTAQAIDLVGRVSSKGHITGLLVDGTDIAVQPDGTFSTRRGIPLGDSEIRVVATDEWGQTSETRIKVTRVAAPADTVLAPLSSSHLHGKPRPNAIALIIGIEQYKSVPPAEFAENDARSFYDYAVNALGVPASRVKLLTGADAQRVDVEAAILTWLKPQVVKGQTEVFVFFSGHGLASDDGKDLYLLPHDGNRALLDRSALRRKELIDMIVDSGAKAATLFLDTCYSGGTRGKETLISSARPILVAAKEQAVPPNVTILAAAGNDQLSSSLVAAKHGLFSYFLMKGLEGDAAGSDRTITAAKLEAYLAEKIPSEAAKLGRTQTPQLIGDGSRVVSSW